MRIPGRSLTRQDDSEPRLRCLGEIEFGRSEKPERIIGHCRNGRPRLNNNHFELNLRVTRLLLKVRQALHFTLEKSVVPLNGPCFLPPLEVMVEGWQPRMLGGDALLRLTTDRVEIADVLRDACLVRTFAMHEAQQDRALVHVFEADEVRCLAAAVIVENDIIDAA